MAQDPFSTSTTFRDRSHSLLHQIQSLPASAPIPIAHHHDASIAPSSASHNYGRSELNRLADELLQVQRHVGQLQARGQELRSRIASYTDLSHLAHQQKQRLASTVSSPQRLAPTPAVYTDASSPTKVPSWFETDLDRGQHSQHQQLHHSNGPSRAYAKYEGVNGEAPARPAYPAYFEYGNDSSAPANGRLGVSSRMGGQGQPLPYYANESARHSRGAGFYPQDQEDVKLYGNGKDRLPETRTVRDVKREQGERKNKFRSKDASPRLSANTLGVPMSTSYHEERSYDRESFGGPHIRRSSQPQVSSEKAAYDSVVTQLRDSLLILRDSQAENRVPNSSTYSSLSPRSDSSGGFTYNGKLSVFPSTSRLGLSHSQPTSPRRMSSNPPYRPPPDYHSSRSSSRVLQPTSWNVPTPLHHRSLHDLRRAMSPSPERMSTRSLPRLHRGCPNTSSSRMSLANVATDVTCSSASSSRRLVPRVKRRHLTVSCSENVAFETRYSGDVDDDWLYGRWTPEVVRSSKAKPMKIDNRTIDKLFLAPDKINIPERYIPEHDLTDMSAEERLKRLKKAEHIKKMLSRTSTAPVISTSDTTPDSSHSSAKEKMAEERKRREQMLNLSQVIAQQVKERSKMVAVQALAAMTPHKSSSSEEDVSPTDSLPIYQQRYNYLT